MTLRKALSFSVTLSVFSSTAFAGMPQPSAAVSRATLVAEAPFDTVAPWLIERLVRSGDRDSIALLSQARHSLDADGVTNPKTSRVFEAARALIPPGTIHADAGMGFFVICYLGVMGGAALYMKEKRDAEARQDAIDLERTLAKIGANSKCQQKVSQVLGDAAA